MLYQKIRYCEVPSYFPKFSNKISFLIKIEILLEVNYDNNTLVVFSIIIQIKFSIKYIFLKHFI